ncbi:MAG TPA: YbaB/EbfC family nucleoid-associated protein [Acidimicrobiales bacterium]|nr:YbaB/EbfC family nucleoid-associated protein [Acidimicrobiales bacterium]
MTDDSPDFSDLLRQARELSEGLAAAQARAGEQVVEGRAGGGAVVVTVTGGLEFRSVSIAPAAVTPDDVSLLEDLVLAALHDAMTNVRRLRGEALGGLAPGLLTGISGDGAGSALPGQAAPEVGGTVGEADPPPDDH